MTGTAKRHRRTTGSALCLALAAAVAAPATPAAPIRDGGTVYEANGQRPASVASASGSDRSDAVELCRADPTPYGRPMGRWAGECLRGRAHGSGAMRIRIGDEDGVFAGRAVAGRPVSGITTLSSGNYFPLAPETPRPPDGQDAAAVAFERAFREAFDGATAASRAYAAAGNARSARYYRRLRQRLIEGQPE